MPESEVEQEEIQFGISGNTRGNGKQAKYAADDDDAMVKEDVSDDQVL